MVRLARRYVIIAAAAVTVFYMFDTQMLAPVLPTYARELGAAPFMVGIMMGVTSLSNAAGNVVFGRLSDLKGRRLPLTIGFIGVAIAVLLYSLATMPLYLVAMRLIHGFFSGATGPCTAAILADLAPPQRRGAYMGIWGMSVSIGVTISSALAGFLAAAYGYFSVFLTIAIVCILASIIIWTLIPETRPMKQVNTPLSGDMPARPSLVSILKRKNVLFACLGILSMYWLLGTIVVTFSRYLAELQIAGVIKPDPKMALGILLSIFGLAAVALNYLFGHLADAVGRKYPLIVAFFMLSIAPLLISNPSVPLIVISWIITWSISASIIWPTLLALLTDELAPHERGAGLGVFMTALMIGTGMGMPVMGAIEGITGASGAIKIAAVFPIITFIVAWFLRPKPVEMGRFGVRAVITTVVIIIALIATSYPLIRFLQP